MTDPSNPKSEAEYGIGSFKRNISMHSHLPVWTVYYSRVQLPIRCLSNGS